MTQAFFESRSLCAFVAVLLLAWTACEREYGIYRSARLDRVPDLRCIRSVLDEIERIESIKESHWEGQVTPVEGIKHQIHRYTYEGSDVRGQLVVAADVDGEMRLSQGYVLINRSPPQATVDGSLSTMRDIANRIEQQCNVPNLTGTMQEVCYRVRCEPSREHE